MKVKIFNRGKGWYISAKNYKDENDRAYMSVRFVNCPEIVPHNNEQGYASADIKIEEASFGAYQGKMNMTVFKYTEVEAKPKNDFRPSDVKTFGDEDFPW